MIVRASDRRNTGRSTIATDCPSANCNRWVQQREEYRRP